MQITHLIDKYCKTPKTTILENASYWYRMEGEKNSSINSGFAKYAEPFDNDLP